MPYNRVVSLVWIIPVLGVSWLTVEVAAQLLEPGAGGSAGRLIAALVGVLMLLEGGFMVMTSYGFAGPASMTTAIHGVGLLFAGAGIWAIAHRKLVSLK